PKSRVAIGDKLAVVNQSFQQIGFKHIAVVGEIFEDSRLEHHETAVDPALVDLLLFAKADRLVAIERDAAKSGGRTNRGNRGKSFPGTVVCDHLVQIDIGDTVAVGEHERFIPYQVFKTLHAAAGQGVGASVHQ